MSERIVCPTAPKKGPFGVGNTKIQPQKAWLSSRAFCIYTEKEKYESSKSKTRKSQTQEHSASCQMDQRATHLQLQI
jgi:hypothetical protein